MKQRGVMTVVLLSIVTLGIYDLYWLVQVKKELNAKTNVKTPTIWLLFAPYLVLFAGVIVSLIIAAASTPSSDQYGVTSASAGSTASAIIMMLVYLVALVVVVPITFYWFFKFSKAVNQYTNGGVNTAVAFILLYMLRFIGMAVIQDHFNDMLAAGTAPNSGQPAMAMPMQGAGAVPSQPADMAVAPQVSAAPSEPASSDQPQDPSQPTPPSGTPMV